MPALTRYRPLTSMQGLRSELDRLMSSPFMGFEEGDEERLSAVWAPRTDVSETDNEFIVRMDIPGIEKKNLRIEVEDNRLSVSGERSEETTEETESMIRVERSYGNFYRSIALPKVAQKEKAKAEFKNGVLTIHVPKIEESKPKRIEVK